MTILARFYVEVTDRGGEACLPRNLSDDWLRVVAESVDVLLGGDGVDGEDTSSAADSDLKAIGVAAVLSILRAKSRAGPFLEMLFEDLWHHLDEYRLELALEEVHRFTDVKYEPASLASIFTNREVRTWRERDPSR